VLPARGDGDAAGTVATNLERIRPLAARQASRGIARPM
jgi:hypothetical protein